MADNYIHPSQEQRERFSKDEEEEILFFNKEDVKMGLKTAQGV